jgi:hypothetical protein
MTETNSPAIEAPTTPEPATLELATAQSTYRIIQALLNHLEASADLIALLAGRLGPEMTQQITQTAAWATYLSARRELDQVKPELEKFVSTVSKLVDSQPTPAQPIAEPTPESTAP